MAANTGGVLKRCLRRPINGQVIGLRGLAEFLWFPMGSKSSTLLKVLRSICPISFVYLFQTMRTSTFGSRMYISLKASSPLSLGRYAMRYPKNSPWMVSWWGGRQLMCNAVDEVLCAVVIVGFPAGAATNILYETLLHPRQLLQLKHNGGYPTPIIYWQPKVKIRPIHFQLSNNSHKMLHQHSTKKRIRSDTHFKNRHLKQTLPFSLL